MAASTPAAFLCYPSRGDRLPGQSPDIDGPIARLRDALVEEVRILTGEGEFDIFMDRRSIAAGEAWQARIQAGLDKATLLIALVQPLLLRSAECRDEIMRFREAEERANRDNLILPVLYVDTPELDVRSPDPIARLLAERQHHDFRPLRLKKPDDQRWIDGVAALGKDVSNALLRVHAPAAPVAPLPGARPVTHELYAFLLRAFSVDELGRFLRWNYPDVLLELSPGAPPAHYVQQVVDCLERMNAIKGPLFDMLTRERPRRREEIDRLRAAWAEDR